MEGVIEAGDNVMLNRDLDCGKKTLKAGSIGEVVKLDGLDARVRFPFPDHEYLVWVFVADIDRCSTDDILTIEKI